MENNMTTFPWAKVLDNKYSSSISDWNGGNPKDLTGKEIDISKCKRHYNHDDNDLVKWSFFDGQIQYVIWND